MAFSVADLTHARRCVELAREALEDGDDPFGSVLVDATETVRFEDRNRVKDGDRTRHPEFEIARWSAVHLTAGERAHSTVYTSGERAAPPPRRAGPALSQHAGIGGGLSGCRHRGTPYSSSARRERCRLLNNSTSGLAATERSAESSTWVRWSRSAETNEIPIRARR